MEQQHDDWAAWRVQRLHHEPYRLSSCMGWLQRAGVFLVLATAERALAHASSTAATEAQQRARKSSITTTLTLRCPGINCFFTYLQHESVPHIHTQSAIGGSTMGTMGPLSLGNVGNTDRLSFAASPLEISVPCQVVPSEAVLRAGSCLLNGVVCACRYAWLKAHAKH